MEEQLEVDEVALLISIVANLIPLDPSIPKLMFRFQCLQRICPIWIGSGIQVISSGDAKLPDMHPN